MWKTTKEEIYIKRKKKELLGHIDTYNKRCSPQNKILVDKKDFDMERTLCRSNICKNCGSCCKTYPCIFDPYDFLDITNLDYMKKLLDTNILCISETYENKVLIIRPRGIGDLGTVSLHEDIKYSWNGSNSCILHSTNGCLLPIEYRPSEGLLHIPIDRIDHQTIYKEEDIEKEYIQYKEILLTLFKRYYTIQNLPNVEEENIKKFTKYIIGYKK